MGPAGGFEPAEVERMIAAGFLAGSLGPRVLRSETAAVAAVAVAQALGAIWAAGQQTEAEKASTRTV